MEGGYTLPDLEFLAAPAKRAEDRNLRAQSYGEERGEKRFTAASCAINIAGGRASAKPCPVIGSPATTINRI